jgi:alpha-tubulin suppressor-like RCC1 family protein
VSSVTALSRSGRVYGWGANNACQAIGAPSWNGRTSAGSCAEVGAPTSTTMMIRTPTPVDGLDPDARVTSIASTQCASWATTEGGDTFAWGAGTAAGANFSECRVPAEAQCGYKIYLYRKAEAAHPFGPPITEAATATVRVL